MFSGLVVSSRTPLFKEQLDKTGDVFVAYRHYSFDIKLELFGLKRRGGVYTTALFCSTSQTMRTFTPPTMPAESSRGHLSTTQNDEHLVETTNLLKVKLSKPLQQLSSNLSIVQGRGILRLVDAIYILDLTTFLF